MGDGTKKNPYTREDVLRLIKENGGKADGLNLSGKVFENGIDLSKLNLSGIILKEVILLAYIDGKKLTFANLEGTNLWSANLEGAVLRGACLKGAILTYAHLEEVDLRAANLEGAVLIAAHLEGAELEYAHLEGADLRAAHLEGAYLNGVEFPRDTKLDAVDWGNYVIGQENDGEFNFVLVTYRRLKIWYTEHGIYDVAGKFFYREMEARRKAQSWKKPHLKLWGWVLRLLCGYGERPERVGISAAVVVLGLALIYFAIGTLTPNTFLDSLYYSAVSFIALGYGQWAPQPTGWAKGMGAAEAVMGVFMMALFLVTFTRKMTR